jgi:hypothetical protein
MISQRCLDLFFFDIGASVGVDERVTINYPKVAQVDYEHLAVTLYLFNNGDHKITTNPSG